MVKGNHVVSILVSLIYAAVRQDSVPAFPDRGCSSKYLIHPARTFLLEKKVICKTDLSVIRQERKQMFRREEPCLHAFIMDFPHKL